MFFFLSVWCQLSIKLRNAELFEASPTLLLHYNLLISTEADQGRCNNGCRKLPSVLSQTQRGEGKCPLRARKRYVWYELPDTCFSSAWSFLNTEHKHVNVYVYERTGKIFILRLLVELESLSPHIHHQEKSLKEERPWRSLVELGSPWAQHRYLSKVRVQGA